MGLTCYSDAKKTMDLNIQRNSKKSRSCNPNYNNIDNEWIDSKIDNDTNQKTKKTNNPTPNSKNKNQDKKTNIIGNNRRNSQKKIDNKNKKEIPKSNSHNDDVNNNNYNKDNDDDNIKENVNDNDNDNEIKSYSNFNDNSKYYLVCPDCKIMVPGIKNAEYDTYRDDFIIEFFCNCTSNGNDKKRYLINFISDKKPENIVFSFESLDKIKSMLDTVREKQDEFQGFQVLDKIYKELIKLRKTMSFNKSMAPPANMQKSIVDNKNN